MARSVQRRRHQRRPRKSRLKTKPPTLATRAQIRNELAELLAAMSCLPHLTDIRFAMDGLIMRGEGAAERLSLQDAFDLSHTTTVIAAVVRIRLTKLLAALDHT